MQVRGRDIHKYSSEQNLKASTAQRGFNFKIWSKTLLSTLFNTLIYILISLGNSSY